MKKIKMIHPKLKQIRLKKGYSGLYIANQIGISKVYYYQIETGKRGLSYEMAVKLSQVLGYKPDDIFYDDYKEK